MLSTFNTFKRIKQKFNFQNTKKIFCGKKVVCECEVKGIILGDNFVFFLRDRSNGSTEKVIISHVNFQIM